MEAEWEWNGSGMEVEWKWNGGGMGAEWWWKGGGTVFLITIIRLIVLFAVAPYYFHRLDMQPPSTMGGGSSPHSPLPHAMGTRCGSPPNPHRGVQLSSVVWAPNDSSPDKNTRQNLNSGLYWHRRICKEARWQNHPHNQNGIASWESECPMRCSESYS